MAKKSSKGSKPSTSSVVAVETPLVIETDPLIAQKIYDFLLRLPPCFRFSPTDDQLIIDYLRPKIANRRIPLCLIHPVNLYKFHPRTLEETHLKHPEGDEEYYFTPRDRKYKNGSRPTRGVNGIGFWKATGADVQIKLGDEIIGYKKTLVFYEGPHKTGKKTNWIMNEYRTCETRKRTSNEDMKLDDWVLCKIHEKRVRVAKMENNEEGDVNTNEEGNVITNEDDNDTENAIINANALKDTEVTDKEDTRLNENHCSTYQNDYIQSHRDNGWPQNVIPFRDEEVTHEEDTLVYENNCSTFHQNDFTQSHQDTGWPLNSLPFNTCQENINMINHVTHEYEQGTCVYDNNCSQNDFTHPHQDTGWPLNSIPFKDEEVTYEYKEDTCVYENNCSASYQNDFIQPHQDMEGSQNSLPFNTCQENFNMINHVPGASYSDTFKTYDPEFFDQWEKDLSFNKGNWSLVSVNSCNFQNSSNGLNVNYPGNFQDGKQRLDQ